MDRQTETWRDKQVDRHTRGQTDTDTQIETTTKRQRWRQADRQTGSVTQTGRQAQ